MRLVSPFWYFITFHGKYNKTKKNTQRADDRAHQQAIVQAQLPHIYVFLSLARARATIFVHIHMGTLDVFACVIDALKTFLNQTWYMNMNGTHIASELSSKCLSIFMLFYIIFFVFFSVSRVFSFAFFLIRSAFVSFGWNWLSSSILITAFRPSFRNCCPAIHRHDFLSRSSTRKKIKKRNKRSFKWK